MEGYVKLPNGRYGYDLTGAAADYPPWHGPPRRSLVICTQQRSGSTLLGEAIYFAKGLGCPLEYFHLGFMPGFQERWPASNIRDYAATVHRFRTDPSGVFSIKIFWRDVAPLVRELARTESAELNALKRTSARETGDAVYRKAFAAIDELIPEPIFVFLKRRDEIRQAISTSVAGQTRLWRRYSSFEKLHNASRPQYDFDNIVWWLAEIQNHNAHWGNFFRANGLPFYEIYYEDLANNYAATLRDLFAAIGRPDAPIVAPRMHKQANDHSEEFLRQFMSEFRRRARG